MTANVMELNLNELVTVTGAMTREEREDALRARDDDGFFETTVKDIARPFVTSIDNAKDRLDPLNHKMDCLSPNHVWDTTKGVYRSVWKTITGWF